MHARITLRLGDVAQAVHDALQPEADEGPEGSTIMLSLQEDSLVADIEATDLSTLRAAMHSVVRLADAAQRAASP